MMGESHDGAKSNFTFITVCFWVFLTYLKHLFFGISVSSQGGLSKPCSQISLCNLSHHTLQQAAFGVVLSNCFC